MTTVAILPVPTDHGGVSYRAVAGDKQSEGKTAGEALDALTSQLSKDEMGTLIIVQNFQPDRFFGEAERERLAELMAHWRMARDSGSPFPAEEQAELDALVEAELRATEERAASIARELSR